MIRLASGAIDGMTAFLERSGRGDDPVGLEPGVGGVDGEARTARIALDLRHLDPGADGRFDLPRVGLEVRRRRVLRGQGVRVEAVDGAVREPVVPGGAIGHQRVPPLRAPALGDAVAPEYEVRDPEPAPVFAHGHAGLAGAHDERVERRGFASRRGHAGLRVASDGASYCPGALQ